MATETGTLEQMLFLTRGVLCANLLTVDTLDGKALYQGNRKQDGMSVTSKIIFGVYRHKWRAR